jgi:hypothetical protein
VRASVRIFLETDADGAFRRRVGTAVAHAVPEWIESAVQAHTTFLLEHRGLAARTVRKRVWQLTLMAEFWDQIGVAALPELHVSHIQQFFLQVARQKLATRRTYGVTLRSFLRWAYHEGRLPTDLRAAVITGRQMRQAPSRSAMRIPQAVEQVSGGTPRFARSGVRAEHDIMLSSENAHSQSHHRSGTFACPPERSIGGAMPVGGPCGRGAKICLERRGTPCLDARHHHVSLYTWFAADHRNRSQRRSVLPRGDPDDPMAREAPAFSVVDVECHAGYRGAETPRRFRLGERQVEIAEVVDTWLAPDHRYFKVRDSQGDLYILRNDVAADRWELTLFRRSADRGAIPPTRHLPDDSR